MKRKRVNIIRARRHKGIACRVAAVAMLALLAACTPRFNWREMHARDGYAAIFPARVARDAHDVVLDGQTLSLRMSAAEVSHVTFAVGVTSVPTGSDPQRVKDALVDAFAAQLHAPVERESGKGFGKSGQILTRIAAEDFHVHGAEVDVFGRIAVSGQDVIEAIVAGPPRAFADAQTREARDTFLEDVKLD